MVVLRAPPVEAVAVHPEGIGVRLPQAQVPRWHHVRMAQDPDLFRPLTWQVGHQVGARAPRHPVIRGRIVMDLKPPTFKHLRQEGGLVGFADPSHLRPQRHPGNQLPLQLDHLMRIGVQALA